MALVAPPTPRLKTQWFRHGDSRGSAQQASAAAFVVWRIARHALDRTRHAGYGVEIGAPYFRFLREVLAFLVAVADRIAHARMEAQERIAFTSAMVHHLARILQDSEDDLLGPAPQGQPCHGDSFIDLVNELAGHYAEFGADPKLPDEPGGFEPDFAFLRYLGHRLEATVPPEDRRWVQDQVISIEAPEAVAMLQRSLRDLFSPPIARTGEYRVTEVVTCTVTVRNYGNVPLRDDLQVSLGADFKDMFALLKEGPKAPAPYASLAEAQAAGAVENGEVKDSAVVTEALRELWELTGDDFTADVELLPVEPPPPVVEPPAPHDPRMATFTRSDPSVGTPRSSPHSASASRSRRRYLSRRRCRGASVHTS